VTGYEDPLDDGPQTEEFVSDGFDYDDDPPPTKDDLRRARAEERRAVGRVATRATQAEALPRVVRGIVNRRGRTWGLVTLALALIAAVLASLVVSNLALSSSTATREALEQARAEFVAGNRQLQEQGRPPVPAPADMADTTETIIAAATARVLAALPEDPTADDVAERIEAEVVRAVIGPGQDRLRAEVNRYFEINGAQFRAPPITPEAIDAAVARRLEQFPPERGERGERGEPCLPSIPECVGPMGDTGEKGDQGDPACPPPRVLVLREVVTTTGTEEALLCLAPEGSTP